MNKLKYIILSPAQVCVVSSIGVSTLSLTEVCNSIARLLKVATAVKPDIFLTARLQQNASKLFMPAGITE